MSRSRTWAEGFQNTRRNGRKSVGTAVSGPPPPSLDDLATAAGERDARPASFQLIENWAGFAKALSIYPPTNSRVLNTLGELTNALEQQLHAAGRDSISVRFARQRCRVGNDEHELVSGTNAAWLDARVRGCGLAGVEFLKAVDRGSLIAFNRRLLDNHSARRRDATFDDLWPSSFAGLRLLPRRFDGGFGDEGEEQLTALPEGMDPDQYRQLVELMLDDDGVLERLERLRTDVAGADDVRSVDVIGRIVGMIPVDRMQDAQSVVALTKQTLDALASDGGVAGRARFDDEESMSRFLVAASQKLFARESTSTLLSSEDADGKPANRANARDDEIGDDLDAFLEEYGALPRAALESLPEVGSLAEQLGVYLHYLVHLESDEQSRRLMGTLRSFLAKRRPDALAVLKEYLELLRPASLKRGALHVERLAELLARLKLSYALRELGIVTAEQTVASFPAGFCTYVDALDFDDVCDRDELSAVCARIGSNRIRGGAKELVSEGLLDGDRARRLLDVSVPSLMPLASVILEKGGKLRPDVVEFLRQLKLDAKAACLLRIAEDPEYFPNEYLQGVLNPDREDRGAAAKLRQWVGLMLCRYLRDHSASTAKQVRCIYALRHLPDFWSEEAEQLVTEIAKPGGVRFFSRKTSPLRRAAQETAKIYGLL